MFESVFAGVYLFVHLIFTRMLLMITGNLGLCCYVPWNLGMCNISCTLMSVCLLSGKSIIFVLILRQSVAERRFISVLSFGSFFATRQSMRDR